MRKIIIALILLIPTLLKAQVDTARDNVISMNILSNWFVKDTSRNNIKIDTLKDAVIFTIGKDSSIKAFTKPLVVRKQRYTETNYWVNDFQTPEFYDERDKIILNVIFYISKSGIQFNH